MQVRHAVRDIPQHAQLLRPRQRHVCVRKHPHEVAAVSQLRHHDQLTGMHRHAQQLQHVGVLQRRHQLHLLLELVHQLAVHDVVDALHAEKV